MMSADEGKVVCLLALMVMVLPSADVHCTGIVLGGPFSKASSREIVIRRTSDRGRRALFKAAERRSTQLGGQHSFSRTALGISAEDSLGCAQMKSQKAIQQTAQGRCASLGRYMAWIAQHPCRADCQALERVCAALKRRTIERVWDVS
jgi:hypothetical protein